jgi:hypothetical protein
MTGAVIKAARPMPNLTHMAPLCVKALPGRGS